MHPTQKKLLDLARHYNFQEMSLRQIGRMIGEEHPQKVKYHLKKAGLIEDEPTGTTPRVEKRVEKILSIPLFGQANCGPATIFADADVEELVTVSRSLLGKRDSFAGLFAVQAVGNSMNRARLNGKSIEDGDYVIVDSEDQNIGDHDYVLAIINNLANIKKFLRDEDENQILLISESTDFYPPIFIHEDDFSSFLVNGKAVAVLKRPKNTGEFDIERIRQNDF